MASRSLGFEQLEPNPIASGISWLYAKMPRYRTTIFHRVIFFLFPAFDLVGWSRVSSLATIASRPFRNCSHHATFLHFSRSLSSCSFDRFVRLCRIIVATLETSGVKSTLSSVFSRLLRSALQELIWTFRSLSIRIVRISCTDAIERDRLKRITNIAFVHNTVFVRTKNEEIKL